MKHFLAVTLLAMVAAGPAFAETRDVSGFTKIDAQDRVMVEVTVGPAYSVEVTGSDAERIRTRIVEGNRLRIMDARRPWFGASPRLDATIRVTAPHIEGLAASRGAQVSAALSGDCGDLSVVAAMGGAAQVNGVACRSVDATAAMGAELRLAGACDALSVTASMGADVRAGDLQCRTVDASASMGGAIRAYASERYDASASMGGDIDIAGEPQRGDASSVMGGSVSRN
jgi:hypothetical protein